MKTIFTNLWEKTKKYKIKSFARFLPKLYLLALLVGGVLVGLFVYLPVLYKCGSYFGFEYCMPLGTYIMMVVSAPGYLIGGNLLKLLPDSNLGISIVLVAFTSLLFYYVIGLLIDKYRKGTLEPIKTIIISSIVISLFLLLALS